MHSVGTSYAAMLYENYARWKPTGGRGRRSASRRNIFEHNPILLYIFVHAGGHDGYGVRLHEATTKGQADWP
jgi:hypothetical protein